MSQVGDFTAYILAGGFGTRLRQVVSDRPKVLAPVLGRPFVFHILDRLARAGLLRVVFCTGYMAQMLERMVGPSYRGMDILYSAEDTPLGTAGALRLALERHPSQLALALNGDSFLNADLAPYLDWFSRHTFTASLLLARVEDKARYGSVSLDSLGRVLGFEEKGQGGPGLINAGVYILRAGALETIASGQPASIETEVFPQQAKSGSLGAFVSEGRFLDIGLPETYAQAGRFLAGVDAVASKGRAAVFLDRDGTVIVERHYLSDPDGVELLPGAVEGLRRMQELGLPLILVTNQSGVGRGYFGPDAVERVHGRVLDLLEAQGIHLTGMYSCPHAPDEDCACRKPLPGLIRTAAEELGLDTVQSFVIGDKPCDVNLGLVVNACSILVRTGYGSKHTLSRDCAPDAIVDDLSGAADVIEQILHRRIAGGEHAGTTPGGGDSVL